MGKISTAASSFIRDAFGRENRGKIDNSAAMALASSSPQSYGVMGVSTSGDMRDATTLDDRLIHRYADYEHMDEYPDISSALDIYADDSTQTDGEKQRSVWIESDDDKIAKDLDNMLHNKVKVEENVWEMGRELCKYGNNYEEIIVSEEGVVGLESVPAPIMRRVEEGNNVMAFVQSYSVSSKIDAESLKGINLDGGSALSLNGDVAIYEPWKIVHMRLRSKNRNSPYGYPVIEPARWVWKRLMLLEDSVMVFKLTRSPSRYAFYVDIGNLPPAQAERKLEELKAKVKKRKFVNPQTGKLDFRYNPLAFDEDFFLGVRDGKESTRIDLLNGPAYQQIEDVQYFLFKLYAALKVPRAYLGYDENMPSKATLSQEDVRFARTVLRIQREIRNGLRKVCDVHLAARRIDPVTVDYDLKMTVPSAIFELGQMEIRNARATLATAMQEHVSLYWMLSNIYNLSDKEIVDVMKQKEEETKKAAGGEGGGGGGFESIQRRVPQITDRELFAGNKESEKRIEDSVKRGMEKGNNPVFSKLNETQQLIREVAEAVRTGRPAKRRF